jgi:hypothetical protein
MSIQLLDFEPELLQLRSSLSILRSHIDAVTKVEKLISILNSVASLPDSVRGLLGELDRNFLNSPKRRVFEFNSTIISLSGFLEIFIENVLRTYLRGLRMISEQYDQMPANVIDRHIPLSFQLMEKIEYSRFKGKLSVETIVKNLHGCTSGDVSYAINEEAFVFHNANFRERILNEYFRQVGVENVFGLIKRQGHVKTFLETTSLGTEDEAYILNDLADLRNDVAHGVEATILSQEMIEAYVGYLDAFCTALCDILRSEWLKWAVKRKAVELGYATKVFDRRIVCFVSLDQGIKVGDILISKAENGHFNCGPILQMQVNRRDIDGVEKVGSDGVGLRVDFGPKPNQIFFLWEISPPAEDQVSEGDLFTNSAPDRVEMAAETDALSSEIQAGGWVEYDQGSETVQAGPVPKARIWSFAKEVWLRLQRGMTKS